MKVFTVSRQIAYQEGSEILAVFETSDSACGFALDLPTLAGSFWSEIDVVPEPGRINIMSIHNRGEFIDVEQFELER